MAFRTSVRRQPTSPGGMPSYQPEATPMRAVLLTLVIAAATACTTTRQGGSYDPNLITSEEIEASIYQNAYDIVRSLRSRWLSIRTSMSIRTGPGSVRIYVDGVGQGSLQSIHRSVIREIRYFPPAEAHARWGAGHQQGAIEVITRE